MNKKQKMYEDIKKHGENLKKLFKLDANIDPLKLCKQLLRLENKAYQYTLKGCNEGLGIEEEKVLNDILNRVKKILDSDKAGIEIFINYDARGHALKISDKYKDVLRELNFFIDWGGYGIIAPNFKNEI